jgi:hypothetical protein|nr:MAG TPA: hypothetical protein [Caudoviricetes sp.]
MSDERKVFEGIELSEEEEFSAETLNELSNNKGDDE